MIFIPAGEMSDADQLAIYKQSEKLLSAIDPEILDIDDILRMSSDTGIVTASADGMMTKTGGVTRLLYPGPIWIPPWIKPRKREDPDGPAELPPINNPPTGD